MPVYNVTVEKSMVSGPFVGEKWSNVYHVNAADLVTADEHADDIAELEQAIYPDNIVIVRLSTRGAPGSGIGFSRNVYLAGTRGTGDPTTQLPLFNAVLYQFLPAEGRPSPKYMRTALDESEVTSGLLDTALTDDMSSDWAAPLVALGFVCDESGQAFAGYSHKQGVQMRQLGWHRRSRPGYHRGWVAD